MSNLQTPESIKAREIYDEISVLQHPFERTYLVDRPHQIRARLGVFMGLVLKEKVTTEIKGDTLVIRTKSPNRITQLENMIRRLALRVDDENLYEEAMRLLGMEV